MSNDEMKIRYADPDDCEPIFDWRNDEHSRSMFFDSGAPTLKEHEKWFSESLSNEKRTLYVGEVKGDKIGVCRFDQSDRYCRSEVSINMNPAKRGLGFGEKFLGMCVEDYLKHNECDLTARIKPHNHASLKIFGAVGFEIANSNSEVVLLQRLSGNLSFKKIEACDAEVLFDLLAKRDYSISHNKLPLKSEHIEFLASNPYRHWALVIESGQAVGSFYIQYDNSIGINLLHPSKQQVKRVLEHLRANFEPVAEIKSKTPPYFYVNVAYDNKYLKEILAELGMAPIQTSFKVG